MHDIPFALWRCEPGAQEGGGRRAFRPTNAGRDHLQMVAAADLLRRRRLERDQGSRWRRRLDEPSHPQRGSAVLDDGTRDAHCRVHGDAGGGENVSCARGVRVEDVSAHEDRGGVVERD